MGAAHGRIELDPGAVPDLGEAGIELRANDRVVGRLFLDSTERVDPEVTARVSAMLASLLATALDRERLALEARASEAQRQRDALEAEALRRSDAVKTAVLRSVSHDLRSPITAIMTAGEVLADMGESLSGTDRGELVASILVQVRRLDGRRRAGADGLHDTRREGNGRMNAFRRASAR